MFYTHHWLIKHKTFIKCANFHLWNSDCTIHPQNNVLQLVLPSSIRNEGCTVKNSNYLSSSTVGDVFYGNIKGRMLRDNFTGNSRYANTFHENIDIQTDTVNQLCSNLNISELGRPNEGRNQTTHNGLDSGWNRISSTTDERNRMFRDYLTKILSTIYAVFIVTLGLVIYISDIVIGNSPIAETFSMYLVIIAFSYMVFLIIDIRVYLSRERKRAPNFEQENKIVWKYLDRAQNSSIPYVTVKLHQNLMHYYCFSKGRHSGSFYLKLGAAGFCLGHLTHSGLLLGYQIVHLTSNNNSFYECASIATLVLDIIYPLYSFLLLYFIFKYSNVIINRRESLARFAFMHCISSSLCFWVWTILRETTEALTNHEDSENLSKVIFLAERKPLASSLNGYNKKGANELVEYINGTLKLSLSSCENHGLNLIHQNFAPYLYPFSVEYSILVVGILFVIWQNIANCKGKQSFSSKCQFAHFQNEESNFVVHADCHSSNKGLFSGIAVFVVCIISTIVYFAAIEEEKYIHLALYVIVLTDIVVLLLMILAGVCAYRQITKLDVNSHAISFLDDLLLFVCIPAFFLNAIFSVIPALQFGNIFSVICVSAKVLQMLVQTPLIIDGLRRCSNSRELRQQKPGRELITFLIVCNVSLWITQTFEIKSHGLQDHRYNFYGKVLWTILGHMTLPLMMFYRFHSSVCLVDIWKSAYEADTAA